MDKERLILVRQLFDEVLKIIPAGREEFLESKCGGDAGLKNEVLSLLHTIENAEDFLENQVTDAVNKRSLPDDPFIGKQIGNFIINGKAGVGGMGIVYSGKRNDESFDQKVAVKILKQGLHSEYLLKRFLIERQTLANLQFPFIARLLDGGKTTEGLPYLVMEFIEGIPITEYCRNKNLNILQRLKLFRDVCSAVQYAHQNLVVHRDLKPGNILVTNDGHPKLLDFGIAKLLDENILEEGENLTRTGTWHLTPEYASPEQIKGETITTASDIYSLGVMLYQILTNQQPYRITNNSPSAINRIITEENILKPSDRVKQNIQDESGKEKHISVKRSKAPDNADKLHSHLKGDLDNIVLKAMHKDPSRRYISAEQFSEDIRKYLIGLPVIAQKDTARYRLSKFIQRHKTGFVISSVFVLFMIASTILVAWQANIAANERDNAKTEQLKAEKVNSFLQEMLSSVDPTEAGKDVKVYDVLKKASIDLESSFILHPEIEAAVRKTIGKTFTNLGEFDQAKPHLLQSVSLNKKVYGEESFQTGESLHELALYYHWIGDLNLADSLYLKSINVFRKNKNTPPRSLASALNDFGTLKQDQALYDESLNLLKEAYNIFIKEFGEKDRDVASTLNNLALTMEALDDLDGAEKYYKRSLNIYTELYGSNRPEISTLYNNLAYIYMDRGDLKTAEEYFKKSLELKKKYYGERHSLVGLALMNLGGFEFRIGKYDESLRYLLEALNNFKLSLNDDHIWVGMSDYWYAKVLIEKSDYAAAEKLLRKSLLIYNNNYPEDHPNILTASGELGISLFYQNKYSEAEKLLIYGYEGVKNSKGEKNISAVRFLEFLVKNYDAAGRTDKAAHYKNVLIKVLE